MLTVRSGGGSPSKYAVVAAMLGSLLLAGCTSPVARRAAPAKLLLPQASAAQDVSPPATAPDSHAAADAALVLDMYARITQAFSRNADDGVRALIASQYPGDLADVAFARCVDAILPGAKTLPRTKRMHFAPNILTMAPDPAYTLSSARVPHLHPRGRIYLTDVMVSDGGKPTVRERHQVVLNNRAYQFTAC